MNVNLNDTKSPVVKVPPAFADTATLRVKKFSFGKSKNSGREQITLETEIVKPDEVEVDGQKYILSGQEITFYLGISDEKAPKAKASPLAQTKEFHTKLGLSMDLDTDNLPYEGLLFDYWLTSSEDEYQRRDANGNFVTAVDEKGQKLTKGWKWSNFLGNVLGASKLKMNETPF